jgi:hypothetical protein
VSSLCTVHPAATPNLFWFFFKHKSDQLTSSPTATSLTLLLGESPSSLNGSQETLPKSGAYALPSPPAHQHAPHSSWSPPACLSHLPPQVPCIYPLHPCHMFRQHFSMGSPHLPHWANGQFAGSSQQGPCCCDKRSLPATAQHGT